MSLQTFRVSVGRHGILRTLRRSLFGLARRVVDFEICRVEFSTGEAYSWPDVIGYETRMVSATEEFHQHLCEELRLVDYRWAFARGDVCSASFRGQDLVGYTFYTTLPTRARDGIAFAFPAQRYMYVFASATAPSHRGKRLEQDRWKIAQRHRIALTGKDQLLVWYVNVTNLEILATSKAVGTTFKLLGYIAYAKIGGRYRFFSSPKCRRAGIGFVAAAAGATDRR